MIVDWSARSPPRTTTTIFPPKKMQSVCSVGFTIPEPGVFLVGVPNIPTFRVPVLRCRNEVSGVSDEGRTELIEESGAGSELVPNHTRVFVRALRAS